MSFELFVATRYLRAKRRQAFVGIITIFVLLAMQYGWTDSFRILDGAPWSQTSSN